MAINAQLMGDLYAYWTLDCTIEIAYAVANDFVNRPHLYQSDAIPEEIADLRMAYGAARRFPNAQQRQMLFAPLFGRSDGARADTAGSAFQTARKKLIDASVAYSERVYDTGLAMLEERIRSAVIPINSHLNSVWGRSLQVSATQSQEIFSLAASILRSGGVASVFGVMPPVAEWPLDSDDPNGAKLSEAIGMMLRLSPENALPRERFILLQRVAREGREAIKSILQPDPAGDANLKSLVTKAYTWGMSLRDFQS